MSGSPQQKNFTPRLTSPAAVAALQHMVDCVKASTPGVLSYDFTVSTERVQRRQDRDDADVVDDRRAGLQPEDVQGRKGRRRHDHARQHAGLQGRIVRGGWGMGIPKNAENKAGAWTILTYLCSREWGLYEVAAHQTDPTRNSVFNSPALNKKFPYLRAAGLANARRPGSSRSPTSRRRSS